MNLNLRARLVAADLSCSLALSSFVPVPPPRPRRALVSA